MKHVQVVVGVCVCVAVHSKKLFRRNLVVIDLVMFSSSEVTGWRSSVSSPMSFDRDNRLERVIQVRVEKVTFCRSFM